METFILTVWRSIDVEIKAAIINAAATFVTALIGILLIFFQMSSQAKLSRDAIAETERVKMKAAIYEDALILNRAMTDLAIELSSSLRLMGISLKTASDAAASGLKYNLPSARFPALLSLHNRFTDAAIKVVFLIEGRIIIDQRLLIFRTAINSVLHTTREVMCSEFVEKLIPILPIDNPSGGIFLYAPPKSSEVSEIQSLIDKFIVALDDIVAYSDDFLRELQNLLLGELFKNKVKLRVPLDPAKKVISLEKSGELEKWFMACTEWGRKTSEVEAEVRASFSNEVRKKS